MFASFKTLFKKINKNVKKSEADSIFVETARQEVENMLTELDEAEERSVSGDARSVSTDNAADALDTLSVADVREDDVNNRLDDTKSEVGSAGGYERVPAEVVDGDLQKTVNKINSLQCPFTWNLKSNNRKLISFVQNKFGEYNLDITSVEFSFERFVGNLIIAFELFHNDKHAELAQMKILEIGKWLEELDTGTDEFYLSIKTGLKHVMSATFIHMLFITNLIGECKWLLDDIDPFASMDPKSRASVHAIRAIVLTEYGGNALYLKKACDCAKKACYLDPNTSHWFYVHSLVLTAQRHFLHSIKSVPSENEIDAIQKAIELSDGRNALYKYHKMTLDKDITIYSYHNNTNKSDKLMKEKNLQENKRLVHAINAILGMEPKDPHLVIKCARTLMTLPYMVRDFKLGKQYLEKALVMAPNDLSVLQAVKKAVKAYEDISKNNKHSSTETCQNQHEFKKKSSDLGEVLSVIVKRHKSGQNVLPSLCSLLSDSKYNGNERCKILAQLCSYTLLFKNNLKSSIEHFITLIEMPEITNNKFLIESHFSSFGSKKFNLADLISNEIRLATNANGTSSGDVLYYNEMLTKIIKMCSLKIKDVDSSMKDKLIVDTSTRLSSNKKYQKEIDSSDNESVNQSDHSTKRNKNKNRNKHLQNTGPRVFTPKTRGSIPESNDKANKKANSSQKTFPTNKNAPRNSQSKSHQTNTSSIGELISKMSKFSSESLHEPRSSNNSNDVVTEGLRNIQTQAEINKYTQQLYQNILQQQCNLHNPFQNPLPPPSLSLRPQINVQSVRPNLQKQKKTPSKQK